MFHTRMIAAALLMLLPASTSAQSAATIISNMATAQAMRIADVQNFTLYGQFDGRHSVQKCGKRIIDSVTSFRCSEVTNDGTAVQSTNTLIMATTGLLAGMLSSDMTNMQKWTTAMTVVGVEQLGSVRAYHIGVDPAKLTGPETSTLLSMSIWIDSSQGTVARLETATKPDPNLPYGTTSMFAEGWREIGGMLFPKKITLVTKATADSTAIAGMRALMERMPAQAAAIKGALDAMERMQSGVPIISTIDSARVNRRPPG